MGSKNSSKDKADKDSKAHQDAVAGIQANEAKEAFTKAKQDDTAAGSGSENLDDVKQYIQIAAASVLPPDTADKAYSMISDNYWPTTLMSVLGFVVGLLFFLTYVLIGSKPGRGF